MIHFRGESRMGYATHAVVRRGSYGMSDPVYPRTSSIRYAGERVGGAGGVIIVISHQVLFSLFSCSHESIIINKFCSVFDIFYLI